MKKIKISPFYIVLLVFIALVLIATEIGKGKLRDLLAEYEGAQYKYVAEELLETKLRAGDGETLADFFADFDTEKAYKMLDQFQLPPKQTIKSMSKGMQEKLQLLLVMCRNAKLYILDEPLGGVDPAARAFILDTIMRNHPAGSTILLSTHLIHDVQEIFDSVLMIGRGKVLVKASVQELCADGRTIEDVFKEVYQYAWQVN